MHREERAARSAELRRGPGGARPRAALRRALLAAIALLYAVSIPWYRDAEARPGTLLGLPDWVAVALGCYAAVALLNAAAWLLSDLDDSDAPRRRSRGGP